MAKERKPRRQLRPKYPLPTHELAVETQLRVLHAIVQASDEGLKEITAEDVAKISKPSAADIIRVRNCLAFFDDIGLIAREKRGAPFKPTQLTLQWAKAWKDKETVLRGLFAQSWFGQAVQKALAVAPENKLEEDKLVVALGEAAEVPPSNLVEPKLKIIIGHLEHFECIAKNPDDTYSWALAPPAEEQLEELIEEEEKFAPPKEKMRPIISINVNFDVDANITEVEAANIAKAIRMIVEGLTQQAASNDSD